MKHLLLPPLLVVCLLAAGLARSGVAAESFVQFPSPDGRFALRLTPAGAEDSGELEAALVEQATGSLLARLACDTTFSHLENLRLLWSADSRRAAFTGPGQKHGDTQVFFWNGIAFVESELPRLPGPVFKYPGRPGEYVRMYSDFVTPVRWLKSGALLLAREHTTVHASNSYEGKILITIGFDAQHQATIRRAVRKKVVVDLY